MFLRVMIPICLLLAAGPSAGSICVAAPLMVEKNLFSGDRKPPAPETEATKKTAKPAMAVGNFQLDGVIILNNSRKAILRLKNQPAAQPPKKGQIVSPFVSVREGQVVNEYRVAKIEIKSISLEKDGQTFVIGLFADNKVSTPVSPVAEPPAQPAAPPQAQTPPGAVAQPVQGQVAPHVNPRHPPRVADVDTSEPVQDPDQPVETIEEQ